MRREGETAMQALKFLVVAMGVLIVVGTGAIVVVIAKRMSAPAGPAITATLHQPTGTRIVAIAAAPDRNVLHLQGGGPDRLVSVDPRTGKVLGTLSLQP
jgi:hypothetical protein